jgi:hypothetical protein
MNTNDHQIDKCSCRIFQNWSRLATVGRGSRTYEIKRQIYTSWNMTENVQHTRVFDKQACLFVCVCLDPDKQTSRVALLAGLFVSTVT